MKLMPLYEKIVVILKNKQEIKSSTGLTYTKDMSISANSTMVAEVVAVGEGRLLADGTIIPLKVKVGDTIIFSKMQGENDYIDSIIIIAIVVLNAIMGVIQESKVEK